MKATQSFTSQLRWQLEDEPHEAEVQPAFSHLALWLQLSATGITMRTECQMSLRENSFPDLLKIYFAPCYSTAECAGTYSHTDTLSNTLQTHTHTGTHMHTCIWPYVCTLHCKLTLVCWLIQVYSVAHTFLTCTGTFTLTPMLTHMLTHTYTLTYLL